MDVITSYHWQLLRVTLCWNRVKGPVVPLHRWQLYSKPNTQWPVRGTILTLEFGTQLLFTHPQGGTHCEYTEKDTGERQEN